MGCSSLGAAVKGERDVGYQRKMGDGVLDKIAAASKAVQQKKAQIEMRKERGSLKADRTFAKAESKAPEAGWWSGEQGSAVAAPQDDEPFKMTEEYNYDEDYDYDAEWDGYPAEDYEYEADELGIHKYDDEGGPSVQLPDFTNHVPVSKARPSKPAARTQARSAPKGNDPWGDSSSGEDVPPPKTKGKGKGKARWPAAEDNDSDDSQAQRQRDRNGAAVKIQAVERGRMARAEATTMAKGEGKGKSKPKPKEAAPRDDASDGSELENGTRPPPNDARQKLKPKAQRKRTGSARSAEDSNSSTPSARASNGSPARSKTRSKARPKASRPGPRGSEGIPTMKSASLADSSDDENGKVMF